MSKERKDNDNRDDPGEKVEYSERYSRRQGSRDGVNNDRQQGVVDLREPPPKPKK